MGEKEIKRVMVVEREGMGGGGGKGGVRGGEGGFQIASPTFCLLCHWAGLFEAGLR